MPSSREIEAYQKTVRTYLNRLDSAKEDPAPIISALEAILSGVEQTAPETLKSRVKDVSNLLTEPTKYKVRLEDAKAFRIIVRREIRNRITTLQNKILLQEARKPKTDVARGTMVVKFFNLTEEQLAKIPADNLQLVINLFDQIADIADEYPMVHKGDLFDIMAKVKPNNEDPFFQLRNILNFGMAIKGTDVGLKQLGVNPFHGLKDVDSPTFNIIASCDTASALLFYTNPDIFHAREAMEKLVKNIGVSYQQLLNLAGEKKQLFDLVVKYPKVIEKYDDLEISFSDLIDRSAHQLEQFLTNPLFLQLFEYLDHCVNYSNDQRLSEDCSELLKIATKHPKLFELMVLNYSVAVGYRILGVPFYALAKASQAALKFLLTNRACSDCFYLCYSANPSLAVEYFKQFLDVLRQYTENGEIDPSHTEQILRDLAELIPSEDT